MSTTYPISVDSEGMTVPLGIDRSADIDGVVRSKAAISGNGYYVFFGTLSSLVELDTDTAYDVYRYTLFTRANERERLRKPPLLLVSAGYGLNSSAPASLSPLGVSEDGTIALFASAGAMNGVTDPNITGAIWQLWGRNLTFYNTFTPMRSKSTKPRPSTVVH